MTSAPLVSVVLCTFNGERHLKEQIDTLLKQDYPHLEFIFSDDASIDNTPDILRSYAAADPRIRIIIQPENVGYNRNFQQGIAVTTGEFIAIADQDDVWELSKIRIMMEAFQSNDVLLVHSRSVTFKTGEAPDYRALSTRRCFNGNDARKLFLYNQISGHNMIVRRTLVEKAFPFPALVYYDWWLAVCACSYGYVRCVDQVLAYHRLHEKNVTVLEKQKPFWKQVVDILPAFLSIDQMPRESKKFGQTLLERFSELASKPFSSSLFRFIIMHAHIIFSFRKYRFPYPSYLKRAWRLASADYVSKP